MDLHAFQSWTFKIVVLWKYSIVKVCWLIVITIDEEIENKLQERVVPLLMFIVENPVSKKIIIKYSLL